MNILLTNIKLLVNVRTENRLLKGKELAVLPCIEDAYLAIENDRIASFGTMDDLIHNTRVFTEVVDLAGQMVLPCWCDSHTHLVFATTRENEFVDKLKGKTYAEIAAAGGGILSSAKAIEAISENELFNLSWNRLEDLLYLGTGAIEIKSGYGLSIESELKMLRVIKRLKEKSPIPIKATFLGAHTYPLAFKENHKGYIDLIINEMLPAIAKENLADFIDVFCEEGFFSKEETIQICNAGKQYGLGAKVHANQLSLSGGVEAGVEVGAISVDHLETMDDASVQVLANSNTIGTMLPTAAFFLRLPFQPARKLIDEGCSVALASDFNPGSSPSSNMNFVVALSCIQMKMLPEEAINAATINGAFAMGVQDLVGSIIKGKKANLIITKPIPSLAYLPYSFGDNLIDKVIVDGKFLKARKGN